MDDKDSELCSITQEGQISGDQLLKCVTIGNLRKFDEIVRQNANRISLPTPPQLYYGIGPQLKKVTVNYPNSDEAITEVPDCEGTSQQNDFLQQPLIDCPCRKDSISAARAAFSSIDSYVCYLREGSFKEQSDQTTLRFNSLIESGNLYAAQRIKSCDCFQTNKTQYQLVEHETHTAQITIHGVTHKKTAFKPWEQTYILFLQADSNSGSHSQWFNFIIENIVPQIEYTFIICNFVKKSSSYCTGMQILFADIAGDKKFQDQGYDVQFVQNKQLVAQKEHFLYRYSSLIFKVTFGAAKRYQVCQHYPYSYTKGQHFLNRIILEYMQQQNQKPYLLTVKQISHSLLDNDIDCVTITSRDSENATPLQQRKVILVTARIHPGESQSSYIVEGLISELLQQNSDISRKLCEGYIFKIIPMLNPDGVIIGNYRCNYSGTDLNRHWNQSSQQKVPELYCVHQLCQELRSQNFDIDLYIDIHGHFKKNSVFAYSVDQFSYLNVLDKNCCGFQLSQCNFGIGKGKEHTGRVELQKQYQIRNSICIECSFFKILDNNTENRLTQELLRRIGQNLCSNILSIALPELPIYQLNDSSPNVAVPKTMAITSSDDSEEDILIPTSKKIKKSTSFVNFIKKNIGIELKQPKRSKKAKQKPLSHKSTHDYLFQKLSKPSRIQSAMPSNHQEKKVPSAEEQRERLERLLNPKRPVSNLQSGTRIVYEPTFNLQEEKLAFEHQFYKPDVAKKRLVQPFVVADGKSEVSKLLNSRKYQSVQQNIKLE